MMVLEYARCDRPVICGLISDSRSSQSAKIGMKATLYRERTSQLLTGITPSSTEGRAAPPSCTRRHPSNSGKGDLDSI